MCIGGKQPEAPVNKPNYAPEDAWKHFETKTTPEPVEQPAAPAEEDQTQKRSSVPKVKATQNQIRM